MSGNGRTARRWLLAGALVTGLVARAPGIWWGANFPSPDLVTHHPDEWTHLVLTEPLIDPSSTPRWRPSYPKGLAAITAVPIVAWRTVTGKLGTPLPPLRQILRTGRAVSVLMGVATILLVFLIGLRVTGDERVGLAAAWFLALGGLHVTQSHFFVADVPATFLLMLGLFLLIVDLDRPPGRDNEALGWAALAIGAAFGVKLFIAGLPSLALATLMRKGRVRRIAHAGVFFLAGFTGINLAMFTPIDVLGVLKGGMNDPYVYSRWMGALIYLIEAPAILGLPLLLLGLAGIWMILRRIARRGLARRALMILAVLGIPVLVQSYNILFDLDVFARHAVPLIPFMALAAGYAIVPALDALDGRRTLRRGLVAAIAIWSVAFVVDGERQFIAEPRNEAYRWLEQNVARGTPIWWYYHNLSGYPQMRFPRDGRPQYLVEEMMQANHILSGVGLRNSYPRDYHHVFDVLSQDEVDQTQAVFKGTGGYREVARFSEGYVMPEYRLELRMLGNRSRNYISEIVIFRLDGN